jgi:hypothetical protein
MTHYFSGSKTYHSCRFARSSQVVVIPCDAQIT